MKTQLTQILSRILLIISISLSAHLHAASDPISASVSFEPAEIYLNQKSYLKVQVINSQVTPKIITSSFPKGINIADTPASSQSSITIVNGKMTVIGLYYFLVRPLEAGQYELPEITLDIDGQSISSPGAKLSVLSTQPESKATDQEKNALHAIFMDIHLSREKIYLGESLPASITLYVDARLSGNILTPYPIQDGPTFANSPFNKEPRRTMAKSDGKNYNAFTWETTVSPIKTGFQKITFKLDLIMEKPATQSLSSMNSPMSNFFNDFFTEKEQLTIATPPKEFEVRLLPELGKPENFSGAVGDFRVLAPQLSSNNIKVGEPITLKLDIEGEGNFPQALAPTISKTKGWKTYPPKATFSSTDGVDFKGKKTFEYVLIPENETITSTPEFEFTFFNPIEEQYFKRHVPALPVTITQSDVPQPASPLITKNAAAAIKKQSQESLQKRELLPIKEAPGTWLSDERPLFFSKTFWAAQLIPLIILVAFYAFMKRKRRLKNDPVYAHNFALDKEIHTHLESLKKAHSIDAFYNETHKLISALISRYIENSPKFLTSQEIAQVLQNKNVPNDILTNLNIHFAAADLARFSGINTSQEKPSAEKIQNFETLYQSLTHFLKS